MMEPKLKIIKEGLNLILEVLVDGYDPFYFKVNGEIELINTNHMKELNIEAPEGYEIDNEKSDLSKGIVRFKQVNKKLTYDDVCKNLLLDRTQFWITSEEIIRQHDGPWAIGEFTGNEAKTKKQLEALLALNKLKNVANYLNDGWKPNWDSGMEDKWRHVMTPTYDSNKIIFQCVTNINNGLPVFKTVDLAKQAIEVLGENTIRLALSFGSI